ncbi:MAG: ribosome maturation factor RimP [Bacteroidetes bacterium]|nr:ribosome maturation factor RimP [Bacteroidota bacterium]
MNPQPTFNPLTARVHALAEEAVAGADLFVVDVEVRGRTGSRVVEVYVDSDAGAGLDEIAETSRRLSFLLDTEDVIKGKYNLHVSSPGASRALALPRQYPHHIGRDLRVTYASDSEETTIVGTLSAVGDDAITLTVKGEDNPTELPFSAIREALVELPW